MAIENGDKTAISLFSDFCISTRSTFNDLFRLIIVNDKYDIIHNSPRLSCEFLEYTLTEDDLNVLSSKTLECLKQANAPKMILTLHKSLTCKIDMLQLHFDYTMEGKGYHEAKQDFLKKVYSDKI